MERVRGRGSEGARARERENEGERERARERECWQHLEKQREGGRKTESGVGSGNQVSLRICAVDRAGAVMHHGSRIGGERKTGRCRLTGIDRSMQTDRL
eukprot:1839871-Rhodomonas_salina.1